MARRSSNAPPGRAGLWDWRGGGGEGAGGGVEGWAVCERAPGLSGALVLGGDERQGAGVVGRAVEFQNFLERGRIDGGRALRLNELSIQRKILCQGEGGFRIGGREEERGGAPENFGPGRRGSTQRRRIVNQDVGLAGGRHAIAGPVFFGGLKREG